MIGLSNPSLATAKLMAIVAIALGAFVAGGACWVAGYSAGKRVERNTGAARDLARQLGQAEAEAQALSLQLDLAKAVAHADQRTLLNLHERLANADQAAASLTERVAHVRLVVPPPGRCLADRPAGGAVAGDAAAGDGGLGRPGPAGAELAAAADAPAAGGDGGDRVGLTLAAVGLYDSALFPGEPGAPELGAVACRAVGTAGAAADAQRCEGFGGVYLDELFTVHIANAASCAKDRARLGRLIEAVKARQQIYSRQAGN